LYFNFFSASFCTTILSAGVPTCISMHVFSFALIIISGLLLLLLLLLLLFIYFTLRTWHQYSPFSRVWISLTKYSLFTVLT
jgi:hypothetical protein